MANVSTTLYKAHRKAGVDKYVSLLESVERRTVAVDGCGGQTPARMTVIVQPE